MATMRRVYRASFIGLLIASFSGFVPLPSASATVPGLNGWIAGVSGHDVVLVEPSSGMRLELLNAGAEEDGVSWAPSGDRLAVISGLSLTVVNAATGSTQVLLENGCVGGRTSWNPDGSTILFHDCTGIAMINADGSTPAEPLSIVGMFQPEWSPDGEWIAAARWVDGDYDIWKVRADGSDATQLTDLPGDQLWPTWSPDGGWIAFEDRQGTNNEIAKVPSDGGTSVNLTNAPSNDGTPNWSPDGSAIVFTSSRSSGVFTMGVDGSDQVRVRNSVPVSGPVWQPAQLLLRPLVRRALSGTNIQLDIQLRWAGTDVPSVQIQRKTLGTGWTQIGSAAVDADGKASFVTKLRVHSRYRALWAGDSGHPAAQSLPVLVEARVEVTGHLYRHYGRSGNWFLYHLGRRVWYLGDIDPRVDGRLCFDLKRHSSGSWHHVARACFPIGAGGEVRVYLQNLPLGFKGRIRAFFNSTRSLDGDRAAWSYFRVTR